MFQSYKKKKKKNIKPINAVKTTVVFIWWESVGGWANRIGLWAHRKDTLEPQVPPPPNLTWMFVF